VPACLIFNKIDLLDESQLQELASLRQLYESLDYPTYAISALNLNTSSEENMLPSLQGGGKPLTSIFQGKITLLSGNSGVGKSTLINAILPELSIKTGEISDYHNKGMHTTTFSEMFPLANGGYLIDTPGIKGFGTFDMEEEEVGHYFKEIFEYSAECKYGNCTHRHEPGCAVREAVEKHLISESRYTSYLNILEDKEEGKYRASF
jgi:ribosome biogenesis GTPase